MIVVEVVLITGLIIMCIIAGVNIIGWIETKIEKTWLFIIISMLVVLYFSTVTVLAIFFMEVYNIFL